MLFGVGRSVKRKDEKRARKVFDAIDKNRDGSISVSEFSAFYQENAHKRGRGSLAGLLRAFEKIDTNGDSTISREEFMAAWDLREEENQRAEHDRKEEDDFFSAMADGSEKRLSQWSVDGGENPMPTRGSGTTAELSPVAAAAAAAAAEVAAEAQVAKDGDGEDMGARPSLPPVVKQVKASKPSRTSSVVELLNFVDRVVDRESQDLEEVLGRGASTSGAATSGASTSGASELEADDEPVPLPLTVTPEDAVELEEDDEMPSPRKPGTPSSARAREQDDFANLPMRVMTVDSVAHDKLRREAHRRKTFFLNGVRDPDHPAPPGPGGSAAARQSTRVGKAGRSLSVNRVTSTPSVATTGREKMKRRMSTADPHLRHVANIDTSILHKMHSVIDQMAAFGGPATKSGTNVLALADPSGGLSRMGTTKQRSPQEGDSDATYRLSSSRSMRRGLEKQDIRSASHINWERIGRLLHNLRAARAHCQATARVHFGSQAGAGLGGLSPAAAAAAAAATDDPTPRPSSPMSPPGSPDAGGPPSFIARMDVNDTRHYAVEMDMAEFESLLDSHFKALGATRLTRESDRKKRVNRMLELETVLFQPATSSSAAAVASTTTLGSVMSFSPASYRIPYGGGAERQVPDETDIRVRFLTTAKAQQVMASIELKELRLHAILRMLPALRDPSKALEGADELAASVYRIPAPAAGSSLAATASSMSLDSPSTVASQSSLKGAEEDPSSSRNTSPRPQGPSRQNSSSVDGLGSRNTSPRRRTARSESGSGLDRATSPRRKGMDGMFAALSGAVGRRTPSPRRGAEGSESRNLTPRRSRMLGFRSASNPPAMVEGADDPEVLGLEGFFRSVLKIGANYDAAITELCDGSLTTALKELNHTVGTGQELLRSTHQTQEQQTRKSLAGVPGGRGIVGDQDDQRQDKSLRAVKSLEMDDEDDEEGGGNTSNPIAPAGGGDGNLNDQDAEAAARNAVSISSGTAEESLGDVQALYEQLSEEAGQHLKAIEDKAAKIHELALGMDALMVGVQKTGLAQAIARSNEATASFAVLVENLSAGARMDRETKMLRTAWADLRKKMARRAKKLVELATFVHTTREYATELLQCMSKAIALEKDQMSSSTDLTHWRHWTHELAVHNLSLASALLSLESTKTGQGPRRGLRRAGDLEDDEDDDEVSETKAEEAVTLDLEAAETMLAEKMAAPTPSAATTDANKAKKKQASKRLERLLKDKEGALGLGTRVTSLVAAHLIFLRDLHRAETANQAAVARDRAEYAQREPDEEHPSLAEQDKDQALQEEQEKEQEQETKPMQDIPDDLGLASLGWFMEEESKGGGRKQQASRPPPVLVGSEFGRIRQRHQALLARTKGRVVPVHQLPIQSEPQSNSVSLPAASCLFMPELCRPVRQLVVSDEPAGVFTIAPFGGSRLATQRCRGVYADLRSSDRQPIGIRKVCSEDGPQENEHMHRGRGSQQAMERGRTRGSSIKRAVNRSNSSNRAPSVDMEKLRNTVASRARSRSRSRTRISHHQHH